MRPVVVMRASLFPLSIAGFNTFWGVSAGGQLGDGTTDDSWTPKAVVGSVTSWEKISAGGYHTCGLAAADGTAYCWGEKLRIGAL